MLFWYCRQVCAGKGKIFRLEFLSIPWFLFQIFYSSLGNCRGFLEAFLPGKGIHLKPTEVYRWLNGILFPHSFSLAYLQYRERSTHPKKEPRYPTSSARKQSYFIISIPFLIANFFPQAYAFPKPWWKAWRFRGYTLFVLTNLSDKAFHVL